MGCRGMRYCPDWIGSLSTDHGKQSFGFCKYRHVAKRSVPRKSRMNDVVRLPSMLPGMSRSACESRTKARARGVCVRIYIGELSALGRWHLGNDTHSTEKKQRSKFRVPVRQKYKARIDRLRQSTAYVSSPPHTYLDESPDTVQLKF